MHRTSNGKRNSKINNADKPGPTVKKKSMGVQQQRDSKGRFVSSEKKRATAFNGKRGDYNISDPYNRPEDGTKITGIESAVIYARRIGKPSVFQGSGTHRKGYVSVEGSVEIEVKKSYPKKER